MVFNKGHKKIAGRPKGVKNKKTEIANRIVDAILGHATDAEIKKIWVELKPKEKMEFLAKFVNFKIPQMARVENENKQPQNITVNMIAATKENKELDNNITIDEQHEEIDD